MIEQLEKESWGLDYHLAQFILPRVLYFKNWCNRYGCPADLEMDEWEEVLDEIVWAFMFVSQSYPRSSSIIVKDVTLKFGEKDERGFGISTLTKIFKEGYTEEDYENTLTQEEHNVQKYQGGFVSSTLTTILEDGYTEEDYKNALAQDERNVQRCQRGLNLFAQYYMSLWN
jgi:hypothetical protein